jgi:lambda repressor-like predicted transcriptional regulator
MGNIEDYNARRARLLTVGGVTMSLTAWARARGLHVTTIESRLRRGWSVCDAIMTPPLAHKRIGLHTITAEGQTLTMAEWARKKRLKPATINNRIRRDGWSDADAVTLPARPKRRRRR